MLRIKKPLFFTPLLVVAIAGLLLASCGSSGDSGSSSAASRSGSDDIGTLRVGTILPETGDLATLGPAMIQAVSLAQKEINEAGGDVKVSPGDSAGSEDVAAAVLDDHLANDVDAILGAGASGISLSLIDKVVEARKVMIAPSNTSPTLTTYDDSGYYFRTAPSDRLQGSVISDLVIGDGGTDVAILHRADDYGRQQAIVAQQKLVEAGAAVVDPIEYDQKASSFEAEAQQVASAGVDAVVIIAFEEGVKVLSALIEANVGPQDVKVFITDGVAVENLGERLDPSNPGVVEGIKATAVASSPKDGEATFRQRFEAFAPEIHDFVFTSAAYDALIILALASQIAGSTDPEVFVSEMVGATRDGVKCQRYAECRSLISAGTNIDYDGASGALEFTDVGEPSAGSYDIFEYGSGGVRTAIDQITIS